MKIFHRAVYILIASFKMNLLEQTKLKIAERDFSYQHFN